MTEKKQKLQDKDIIIFKKVSDLDKYNFYEYLSVMLDSWVWVVEALESVQEKLDNIYFKQRINQLLVFIASGDSLSKAMKKDPHTFWAHEISIIEAWESTWTLDKSLADLAVNIKNIYELKKKIKASLTYPAIIFLFLIVAVVIILTYVIPSLIPLFEDFNATLPTSTKALIATSDFLIDNWLLLVFLLFSWIIALLIYKNTESWKENIDNFILNTPLIWDVYKNYILANISLTMWNLIWWGVSTIKMLKLVWNASWSHVYNQLFNLIAKKVESWEKIVDSMQEIDVDKFYFPTTFTQLMSVWERTANLEVVSKKVHNQFKREVEYSLATLTKWIEPLAVFLASIFVLWFAFAIFWAIMKLTSSMN